MVRPSWAASVFVHAVGGKRKPSMNYFKPPNAGRGRGEKNVESTVRTTPILSTHLLAKT
jgi:hypothetical protein